MAKKSDENGRKEAKLGGDVTFKIRTRLKEKSGFTYIRRRSHRFD